MTIYTCECVRGCVHVEVDHRSSQQVPQPLPPSCSPGTAHWWHQLVWKWPLVPPHHCGTNIAAQGFHQTGRTAVVRGWEMKPGQMMIHIHLIPPPPQFSLLPLPRDHTVAPETDNTLRLQHIGTRGIDRHTHEYTVYAHTHTHTPVYLILHSIHSGFFCMWLCLSL